MKTKINLILFIGLILLIGCNYSREKENIERKEIAVLKYVTHPALDELENAYVNRLDSLLKTSDSLKGYYIKKIQCKC